MYVNVNEAFVLQDYIALRGEVYFPNLAFEKTIIDFGCVLNDTEVTRYVNVTNNRLADFTLLY